MPDVDLDALAPQARRVKIQGKWYTLPAELGLQVAARAAAAKRGMREAQAAMGELLSKAERITAEGVALAQELEAAQQAEDEDKSVELEAQVDAAEAQLTAMTEGFGSLETQAEEAATGLADVAYELLGESVTRETLDLSSREADSVITVAMGGEPTQSIEEVLGKALEGLDPPAPAEAGKKEKTMAVPKPTKKRRRAPASQRPSPVQSSS